jgi:ribosomal protein S18 acetylase RimI-like enzyme
MSDPVQLSSRPVSPQDEDFLWRVYASTREREVAAFGWPPAQQEAFLRMQYRARCQSYAAAFERAEHSVLLADGVPAGFMIVARGPSETRLVDIALLPEYRGRGLGGSAILGLIRETGAGSVPLRLSVQRGNPAIRLYQRLGFSIVSAGGVYIEMEHHARIG